MKIPTVEFLEKRKATIRADLLFKVEVEDYHGVADCAMDLRELEAQLEVLTSLRGCDHLWRYDMDTDGAICEKCKECRVSMPV